MAEDDLLVATTGAYYRRGADAWSSAVSGPAVTGALTAYVITGIAGLPGEVAVVGTYYDAELTQHGRVYRRLGGSWDGGAPTPSTEVRSLAVAPNGDLLTSTVGRIYRRVDGVWDSGVAGPAAQRIHGIGVARNGDLLASSATRIYRRTSGSWDAGVAGPSSSQIVDMAITRSGTLLVSSTTHIYRRTAQGTWVATAAPLGTRLTAMGIEAAVAEVVIALATGAPAVAIALRHQGIAVSYRAGAPAAGAVLRPQRISAAISAGMPSVAARVTHTGIAVSYRAGAPAAGAVLRPQPVALILISGFPALGASVEIQRIRVGIAAGTPSMTGELVVQRLRLGLSARAPRWTAAVTPPRYPLPPDRWAGLYAPPAMRALVDGVVVALDAEPRAYPLTDVAHIDASVLPHLAWYLAALAYDIEGSEAQQRAAVGVARTLTAQIGTEAALATLGAANGLTIALRYLEQTGEGTPYDRRKNVAVDVSHPTRIVDSLWLEYLGRAIEACLPFTLDLREIVIAAG